MFSNTAASLRAAAIQSENKAEQAMANAQARQMMAQKQNELAKELEAAETIALLEKDSISAQLFYQKANSDYRASVYELEKARALVGAATKRVAAAEELRQSASKDYSQSRARINSMKSSLKKGCSSD